MSLILIADDHPIAREPLAKLLSYEGYETTCASNGLEALDAIRRRRPDLILLDLMMPKMGGLAFLQAARDFETEQHDPSATIPIILLTAITDSPDLARARELGATEIIPKARFTVEELLVRIRAHLPQSV
jgi:CheY-like chemotaxis protein